MLKKLLALFIACMALCSSAAAQTLSPVTGLLIDGEPVAPMLCVISHSWGDVKYNGHVTTAQGVGKRQGWGGQKADIIYEAPLYQDNGTRLAYLFHDALANGEEIEAGPIRSVRTIHVQLAQAWNGGLIYSYGLSGNAYGVPQLLAIQDTAYTNGEGAGKPFVNVVKGVRAPDNRSASVAPIHALMEDKAFRPDPLVFTDEMPDSTLPKAVDIKLNWGDEKRFFSRFVYDEDTQTYQWYSNKVPMKNWLDATRTQETELFFRNVIVQYVPVSFPVSRLQPETDLSYGGRAQIFMGGRLIEAEWINRGGSIHYVDAQGKDLPLQRGKTYVAIWPDHYNQLSYK